MKARSVGRSERKLMKKKIPALLLALSLLLTIPAQAVLEAGFSRQRSYAGEFSDLKADSPFYDNVIALYEYGLANGKANGTFGLQDPLTVGQVVIFAGRIRGSYRTGNPEEAAAYRQEGAPEAQAHLRYLQAEGVLGAELDGILSQAASRAQVAHVLARVLPEEALPSVHSELVDAAYATGRYIADVTGDTPYAQDILDLYRKGVCVGSDAAGTFLPGEPITRGAAAAMITRMVDPALRLQPQWDATRLYSAAGATLASLVEPGTYAVSPSTEKELEDIGFQLQVKKLVGPLEQLGYERAWFSTELDHIWLKEDACCIISREFDPNDMFDTAAVSLWGMGKETVWALAEQFKRLGYGNALEMRDGST